MTEHLAAGAAAETRIEWRSSLRSGDASTRVRPSPRVLAGESTVHLVNPSHLSFGVGVITPRWLFVLASATPASYGRPHITDETLEPFDVDSRSTRRCRRHRYSHRQCPSRIRNWHPRESPRGSRDLRRHPRHALPRRGARVWAAHMPSSEGTATSSGRSCSPMRRAARCSGSMRPAGSMPTASSPRAGSCCRRVATCGARSRPSAVVRSTARSALSGAPMARRRDSVAWMSSSRRFSSFDAAASVSWRSPTTTSTRSRWPTSRWRSASTMWRGSSSFGRCARSDSS